MTTHTAAIAVTFIACQVYPPSAVVGPLGASQAHMRSKEHLLSVLHARVLDKHALVRQRTLNTWSMLVECHCVPLSWWNTVLSLGECACEGQCMSGIWFFEYSASLIDSIRMCNTHMKQVQLSL